MRLVAAEEDVEGRCHQVQVFGTGQIDQEVQYHQDMCPPEYAICYCVELLTCWSKYGAKDATNRRPGGTIAGGILKGFDKGECQNDQKDQTQDNKAVPWTMQGAAKLAWAYDATPNSESYQC